MKQAKDYCVWKTTVENQRLKLQGKSLVHNYRIPTDAEWMYASFGGINPSEIEKPEISELTKIGAEKPNDWGLCNMFDNVSEWTYTAFEPEKYMTKLLNYPKNFS